MSLTYQVYELTNKGYTRERIAQELGINQKSVNDKDNNVKRRIRQALQSQNPKQKLCTNCGYPKQPVTETGSFLCRHCQKEQFERIKNIAKPRTKERDKRGNKMTFKKVGKLAEQGLAPEQIADQLGIKVSTTKAYISRYKNAVGSRPAKSQEEQGAIIKKLKQENEQLKQEIHELNKRLGTAHEKEMIKNLIKRVEEKEDAIEELEEELMVESRKHEKLLEYIMLHK